MMSKNHVLAVFQLLVFISLTAGAQNLPARKGQTDKSGRKQGEWVIWYNDNWKETKNADSALFYRKMTYRDNQPVDLVQDFYRNGKLQWKGRLISEGPPAIYDGMVSWYYEDGQPRLRAVFSNGELTGGFTAWRRDGTLVEGPWDAPVQEAENEEDGNRRLALYLKARDNAEAIFTSHSVEYATQQENAAYEYLGADRYEDAVVSFGDAIRLFAKLLPPDDLRIPDAMEMLAYCLNRSGKHGQEREVLQQLVARIEKFHGGYTPNAAGAWASLADLTKDEPDIAEEYLQKGYGLMKTRTQSAEDFNQQRYVIYSFHNFLMDRGDWQKAYTVNAESIAQTRRWLGKDSEMEVDLLSWRRQIQLGIGQPEAAYETAKEHFVLASRILSPDDPRIANALVHMADWEMQQGRFAEAEKIMLEAKDVYEKKTPVTDPSYGTILNKLRSLYHTFHQEEKENLYASAFLKFLIKTNGLYSQGVAQFYLELAADAMESRRMDQTEGHLADFEKVLKNAVDQKTIDQSGQQELEGQLAMQRSLLILGRYQEIRRLLQEKTEPSAYDRLLKLSDRMLADAENQMNTATRNINLKDQRGVLLLYEMMAFSKVLGGNLESADSYILKTVTGNKTYYGENSPEYCEAVTFRAWIQKAIGNTTTANQLFAESFRNYRQYCVRVAPYLSESERQIFYNKLNGNLQEFFLFAAEAGSKLSSDATGNLFNALLLSKSAGLDHVRNIREQLSKNSDSESLNLFQEWKSLKEQLIVLYRSGSAASTTKTQSDLEDRVNRIERELAARSKSFSDFNNQLNTDWKKISAALKTGEAAVDMIRVENAENNKSFYIGLILKPGGQPPTMVVLPDARQLDNRNLRFYHNAIRNNLTDTLNYGALWKPIANAIGTTKRVYFSPDGLYNQLNLQTFKNPATGKFLGEETDITLLTTTRQLLRPIAHEPLREVVMFGNPDFGKSADVSWSAESNQDRSANFFQVPDLPGTKAEIDGLAQIFRQGKIKHRTFTRSEANEENIRTVSGTQVLHIATHGFFMQNLEKQSFDDRLQGFMGKKAVENPMLRSGLMLAGCRSATDQKSLSGSDGVLTAFEAANLDLSSARMVVMSACETGLGTVINGEGVIGLPRAFLSAGSQSVLMSLWKVDDQATQELMRNFYGRWAKSGDAEASWKQAQNDLRVKYPSPYYWGAFVLLR